MRQALNYAIDIDLIVEEFLDGLGEPLPTILSPLSFGYNDELEPYPYDPEKARQLLAEAGYPNGFTMELSTEDVRRDIAEAYAFMLSQVGITVNVRPWGDRTAMYDAMARGELDAMLTDWGDSAMDPLGIFLPKLRTGDRGNYGGYSNPEVDDLINRAESTTDPELRAELYRQAQAIVRDAPLRVRVHHPGAVRPEQAGQRLGSHPGQPHQPAHGDERVTRPPRRRQRRADRTHLRGRRHRRRLRRFFHRGEVSRT